MKPDHLFLIPFVVLWLADQLVLHDNKIHHELSVQLSHIKKSGLMATHIHPCQGVGTMCRQATSHLSYALLLMLLLTCLL